MSNYLNQNYITTNSNSINYILRCAKVCFYKKCEYLGYTLIVWNYWLRSNSELHIGWWTRQLKCWMQWKFSNVYLWHVELNLVSQIEGCFLFDFVGLLTFTPNLTRLVFFCHKNFIRHKWWCMSRLYPKLWITRLSVTSQLKSNNWAGKRFKSRKVSKSVVTPDPNCCDCNEFITCFWWKYCTRSHVVVYVHECSVDCHLLWYVSNNMCSLYLKMWF